MLGRFLARQHDERRLLATCKQRADECGPDEAVRGDRDVTAFAEKCARTGQDRFAFERRDDGFKQGHGYLRVVRTARKPATGVRCGAAQVYGPARCRSNRGHFVGTVYRRMRIGAAAAPVVTGPLSFVITNVSGL